MASLSAGARTPGGHKDDMNAVSLKAIGWILALAAAPSAAQSAGAPERQQALALEQQGKIPEAEAAWRAILKAHPDIPEPYAQLGLLEARQEHYKEAILFYRKAIAIEPHDSHVPALRLNLGLALFKEGQLKESIPEFTELLENAPPGTAGAQRLNILIGMAHYGLGQYTDAIPYLRTATVNDPANLPLRLYLAHSCLWSRQFQCVMDVYREILNLNAESAEADMLAGEAMDEMKDNAGATKMFRAAAAANPKEPEVHFGLAYLLWTQKQYPEAVQQFEAELANNPSHTQSMLYLGDSELQLNKAADARPWLEKAVKLNPSLWLGDLDLGIIDSDAGHNDEALHELEAAAKLKPDDVDVHWRLARLYRAMGRMDQARVEFDNAKKLNKQADETLYQQIAHGRQRPPAGDSTGTQPDAPAAPASPASPPQH